MQDLDLLRAYLGERIPDGASDEDTFFSDAELTAMMTATSYGVLGAAVIGWAAKAGEYARLIDINESGGQRLLSQKFRQANVQLQFFQKLLDSQIATNQATVASGGRVGPKVLNWADTGCEPGVVLWAQRFHRFPPLTPQDPRYA
jgi:hypothetical protein